MKIVKASEKDISLIVDMKLKMSKELGIDFLFQENIEEKIKQKYLDMYREDKGCHFILYEECEVVAIGGAMLKEDVPFCFFKTPYYGFIIDVYCIPEKRRKGYATEIMKSILKWLEEKEVHTIKLKPSHEGRLLYEKLGFRSSDEMEKII